MSAVDPANAQAARTWLIAAVRGDAPPLPATQPIPAVVALAQREGVSALVAKSLRDHPQCDPGGRLQAALAPALMQQTASVMMQEHALTTLLPALEAADCTPTLVKGCALSLTHYDEPGDRPRTDIDILVPESAKAAAHDTLRALGLRESLAHHGHYVSFQSAWTWPTQPTINVDLHWRINNSLWFAFRLPTADICAQRRWTRIGTADIPVPDPVDALIHAALHRLAESKQYWPDTAQPHGNRLIWLYDAVRLIGRLSDSDWERLTRRAERYGLTGVVVSMLNATAVTFAIPLPEKVMSALGACPSPIPLDGFFTRGWRHLRFEAQALPSWHARWRYLREVGFPSADYMQAKFGPGGLPLLYVRRAMRGLGKWR